MYKRTFYIIIIILAAALSSFAQTSLLNPNNYSSLAAAFNPAGNVTVNMSTNQLSIASGSTYTGVVDNGILVFTFDSFTLSSGRTISFTVESSPGNKVAFLSKGNMTIGGTINGSANHCTFETPSIPGPGGGAGGAGCLYMPMRGIGPGGGIGGTNPQEAGASCGGGFGGRGGGSFDYHTSELTDGLGSGPYGNLSIALDGGSGGGHGEYAGKDVSTPSFAGSGGGAIALGARGNMLLQSTSSVLANGGNGENYFNPDYDGTGGGSGGGILIYGASVDIQSGAIISAKGGNGGTGGPGYSYGGGGGGGGRVSIYYSGSSYSNLGNVNVSGGAGGTDETIPGNPGEAGGDGVFVALPSFSTILPVELASFEASVEKSNNVRLSWTTATEVNNYGFEVERKEPESGTLNGDWLKIGFVKGHGNSNASLSYSFTDEHPLFRTVLYRLKQIDNDGAFEFNEPVSVKCTGGPAALLQNHPNPFNPNTVIAYSLPFDGHVNIRIYNTIGETVKELADGQVPAGYHEITFSAGSLPTGIYFYSITAFSPDGKEKFSAVKKMMYVK